jgi:hypothetical protein
MYELQVLAIMNLLKLSSDAGTSIATISFIALLCYLSSFFKKPLIYYEYVGVDDIIPLILMMKILSSEPAFPFDRV